MIKIVNVEEMKAIEDASAAAGHGYSDMMQLAGRAVADTVIAKFGATGQLRVAILVGPGNNGGDGLVAARILKEETDFDVGCYLIKARPDDEAEFAAAKDAGVSIALAADDRQSKQARTLVGNADVVVDALLGTGAKPPLRDEMRELLQLAGSIVGSRTTGADSVLTFAFRVSPQAPREKWVVAVDCPSGTDCDTGAVDEATLCADVTVTFAAVKAGLLRFPGAFNTGELIVADIGISSDLPPLATVPVELVTAELARSALPRRTIAGHKGTFGRALIIAGSISYPGAVSLAGAAAYRAGTGLVTMAVPQPVYPIAATRLPEATWLLLPHELGLLNAAAVPVIANELEKVDSILLGPGLGHDEASAAFVRGLILGSAQAKRGQLGFVGAVNSMDSDAPPIARSPANLVIDADGLNCLTEVDEWWEHLPANTILTPHPGEMARLTGLDIDELQQDRTATAQQFAAGWDCIVVLKGAFTVVASPDGRVRVIPFASDALASAGTGDALAGCITGLLAQGCDPFDAASTGAYVHGLAGLHAAEEMGARSVVATDVIRHLSSALQALGRV